MYIHVYIHAHCIYTCIYNRQQTGGREGGREGGEVLINIAIYMCIHNVYTMHVRRYMYTCIIIHCMYMYIRIT